MPGERPNALRLHPADEVVVAMRRLSAGDAVAGEGVVAAEAIPSGRKVAVPPVAAGRPVHKYGQVIGAAKVDITLGAYVHVHNLGLSGVREAAPPGASARQEAPRSL